MLRDALSEFYKYVADSERVRRRPGRVRLLHVVIKPLHNNGGTDSRRRQGYYHAGLALAWWRMLLRRWPGRGMLLRHCCRTAVKRSAVGFSGQRSAAPLARTSHTNPTVSNDLVQWARSNKYSADDCAALQAKDYDWPSLASSSWSLLVDQGVGAAASRSLLLEAQRRGAPAPFRSSPSPAPCHSTARACTPALETALPPPLSPLSYHPTTRLTKLALLAWQSRLSSPTTRMGNRGSWINSPHPLTRRRHGTCFR